MATVTSFWGKESMVVEYADDSLNPLVVTSVGLGLICIVGFKEDAADPCVVLVIPKTINALLLARSSASSSVSAAAIPVARVTPSICTLARTIYFP